jgi:hypothetical protein
MAPIIVLIDCKVIKPLNVKNHDQLVQDAYVDVSQISLGRISNQYQHSSDRYL